MGGGLPHLTPSSQLPASQVRFGWLLCLRGQEKKGPYADCTVLTRGGVQRHLYVLLLIRPSEESTLPPYLSVSCRLLPLDKEIERKKPWTAGTVYSKRVLDKSCWDISVSLTLLSQLSSVKQAQLHTDGACSEGG